MFKKFLKLASGTAVAQVITFLCLPIITRLYSPYDFGVFSNYSAVIGVIMPIAALCYPIAIVLTQDKIEENKVAYLSILVSIIISIISLLVLLILKNEFYLFIGREDYFLILLTPLALIGSVLFQVKRQIFLKYEKYKDISKSLFVGAIAVNFFKIFFGYYYANYIWLIVAYVFNYIIQYLYLLLISGIQFKKDKVLEVAIKFKDFAYYRTPQNFVFLLSESLPILFIGKYLGPESAGFYSLGRLTLGAPLALIGQVFVDVLFTQLSKLEIKSIKEVFLKSYKYIIPVSFLVFIILYFSAESIYYLVFGPQWGMAGTVASVMSFWFLSFILFRPFVALINIFKLQKFYLFYELIGLFFKTLGMFFSIYFGYNLTEMILVYSLVSFLINIIFSIFLYGWIFKWKN